MIQFRFHPSKALQAISWMLSEAASPLDFHTILKTAYFSDKEMLNSHGRPIFGANYRAMNYGPVPLEVYEMLKCEPYWLTELPRSEYPWIRTGFNIQLKREDNKYDDLDDISSRELCFLRSAFSRCQRMTFNERTRETHGIDWVEGTRRIGERMAYEDMIDRNNPHRDEIIEDLIAAGPRLAL